LCHRITLKHTERECLEHAERLDDVREALRRADLKAAAKLARVYRLMPISA
jgi:hypothetical protein